MSSENEIVLTEPQADNVARIIRGELTKKFGRLGFYLISYPETGTMKFLDLMDDSKPQPEHVEFAKEVIKTGLTRQNTELAGWQISNARNFAIILQ